ncbi:MAG: hypothetical protein OQJ98_01400 [Candidatus Pacebacteria bacterium]|nr:hypothetical protein [Candidatus Paceibacterota bacterium]
MNEFPILSLIALDTDILWYIFLGVILVFLFYSIFLVYHWFRFGMNVLVSLIATVVYAGASAAILLTMLLSFASLIS